MSNKAVMVLSRQQEEEKQFYSAYEWCLNPLQRLRDLLTHLGEELDHADAVVSAWQRDECRINLYLLTCAIACTVDDYLIWRPWVFTALGSVVPALRIPLTLFQRVANVPYQLTASRRLRFVHQWRETWTACVEESCRLLLCKSNVTPASTERIRSALEGLKSSPLPEDLLDRRMKINEGYRCQDLTHHDILILVNRFLESGFSNTTPIVIVGPRTAGAYFAPMVKVYLESKGFNNISWMTIRPKVRTTPGEYHRLRHHITEKTHFILTDDYSNTGLTFRLLQEELRRQGVPPDRIIIFAPLHPARPNVSLALDPKTRVFNLRHGQLYKEEILKPTSAEKLFKQYLSDIGNPEIVLLDDPQVEKINAGLWSHYTDGFQVRLKRLYKLRSGEQTKENQHGMILGKSVGWGWLGYHAYLAAIRLRGFVPAVLGLRDGILYMQWLESPGGMRDEYVRQHLPRMAEYIVQRTRQLGLTEDPRFAGADIGWGWLEILSILRRVYGYYPGYLKHHALLNSLRTHVSPFPVLVDGHMRPEEWFETSGGPVKIDFEHHNFGAPELDIVDPAYDLAALCFEFHLSKSEEEALLQAYSQGTGDRTISDRIVLYKLLYGHTVKRKALEGFHRKHTMISGEAWNERYQRSWDFLVYSMNRLFASMMSQSKRTDQGKQLFFLDLDGVLDAEYFGFPHTTKSGVAALSLLLSRGFTVIPNTGRSISHVRDYCSAYGFPYGIAEYGSVIYDRVRGIEKSLIDIEVEDQLRVCREALAAMTDVYLDSGYRYAVRAYRYTTRRTIGLERREAEELMRRHQLTRLHCITRNDDTYFCGVETGKGNAIEKFRDIFQYREGTVTAIGDSDEDVSMLQTADHSFAPANCSDGVRILAKKDGCRIVSPSRQQALLKVAESLTGEPAHKISQHLEPGDRSTVRHLIYTLSGRAESSRLKKFISLFFPYSL